MKLSIIIPMYNAEKFILRALDSIPAREDVEVLVIDDCSTDGSLALVKNYMRIPLRIFQTPINQGTGAATNIGYDQAQGDYVVGLDNDDYLLTAEYNQLIEDLYHRSEDIIFFGNRINTGQCWFDPNRTAI